MQEKQHIDQEDEHDLEIIKAVAQAWHGHSNSSTKPTSDSEFDAHRMNFKSKPTRFKLEATTTTTTTKKPAAAANGNSRWDFGQSLWDSYEIVSVSKKLERGSVLDYSFSVMDEPNRTLKTRKESKNSLRNLFAKDTSSI